MILILLLHITSAAIYSQDYHEGLSYIYLREATNLVVEMWGGGGCGYPCSWGTMYFGSGGGSGGYIKTNLWTDELEIRVGRGGNYTDCDNITDGEDTRVCTKYGCIVAGGGISGKSDGYNLTIGYGGKNRVPNSFVGTSINGSTGCVLEYVHGDRKCCYGGCGGSAPMGGNGGSCGADIYILDKPKNKAYCGVLPGGGGTAAPGASGMVRVTYLST